MTAILPGNPSKFELVRDVASIHVPEEPQSFARKWYFSRQELEDHSPSRKDGIGQEEESYLRKLYCSFIQELGMELKVPQLTIATAMMFCHRFYMRQSHAKNCWQTVATACVFLGCKAEETSSWLSDIVVVAYKLIYQWDPSAPRRIKQKEIYDKQKELILNGERFLLATLAFDMNIEHPYKPLVGALKRLKISDKELTKIAWNFVNDWLQTTLCLQYKPHCIAAGSVFLAAKIQKVKLPKEKGKVWWMQFDVSPKHFEEVVQQMMGLLEQNQKQAQPPMCGKETVLKPKALSTSPESCNLSGSVDKVKVNTERLDDSVSSMCHEKPQYCDFQDPMKGDSLLAEPISGYTLSCSSRSSTPSGSVIAQNSDNLLPILNAEDLSGSLLSKCNGKQTCSEVQETLKEEARLDCHASDSGSAISVVEDCEGEPVKEKPDLNSSCEIVSVISAMMDVNRIKETLRKRRQDRIMNKKLVEQEDNEMDSEAWIERELETGIKLESAIADKRRRL